MNKKEISEIKKQFTEDRCTISRIATCYVDANKEIKFSSKDSFFNITKEEEYKYFDLFRKSLSGTLGTNLFTMEFNIDAENPGGEWDLLYRLNKSELKDDALIDEFFDKIISSYDYGQNYYIILIRSSYDIPGRTKDSMELEDASEYTFSYINTLICPVSLTKGCLSYNPEENLMKDRIRDWIVEPPQTAFMFPAFNDRNTDLHSLLYYTKAVKEMHPEFIEKVLNVEPAKTSIEQKADFNMLIEDTLDETCEFEVVKNIHDNIKELVEMNADNPDPVMITKDELKQIFYDAGADGDKMTSFDDKFDTAIGSGETIPAASLINKRSFKIETPDISIKVNPERTDLLKTMMIEGQQCLVIAVDSHLTVNGVDARTFAFEGENNDDDGNIEE